MKGVEVMATMFYVGSVIIALNTFNNMLLENDSFGFDQNIYPPCASDSSLNKQWRGTTESWLFIETLVFTYFLLTMIILLAKSRCSKIGTDQQAQFSQFYMSKMIQRITEAMNIDMFQAKKTHEQTKKFYTEKSCNVEIEAIKIRVLLRERDYDDLFTAIVLKDKPYVKPYQAAAWLKNNVVGNITRDRLDKQRQKEVNTADLMQNTSLIYHSESVLEMQFLCLVTLYYWGHSSETTENSSEILVALIAEHIFAYSSGIFRKWEIDNFGKLDVNGVYRAQKESLMSTVEIFVDCIIFGYALNQLF